MKIETDNLKGIMFMLVSSFSTALLLSLAKILSSDISSSYIVFIYKALVLCMILPWVFKNGVSAIYTKKIALYIVGAIFSATASICLIYSLSYIPLINATCLGYMEKVGLVIIGMIFFNESCKIVKFMAVLLGFMGAAIIVNPRIIYGEHLFEMGLDWGYVPVFLSIVLWMAYCIIVKLIGRAECGKTQIFYNTLFSVMVSFISLIVDWGSMSVMDIKQVWSQIISVNISGGDYMLLQVMAICYLVRSIASFKALQCSELSVVVPFGYAKVIFSGVFGALFFAQYPAKESYIGYSAILIAVYFLFKSELANQGNGK